MKVRLKHAIISGRNDTNCGTGEKPGTFGGRNKKKNYSVIELAEK